jgi:hypothetical protein
MPFFSIGPSQIAATALSQSLTDLLQLLFEAICKFGLAKN